MRWELGRCGVGAAVNLSNISGQHKKMAYLVSIRVTCGTLETSRWAASSYGDEKIIPSRRMEEMGDRAADDYIPVSTSWLHMSNARWKQTA